jgi:methionyl-tRNA formyltransferase
MRALIFTDVNSPVSAALVLETLRICRLRRDIEICGIVTSAPARFRSSRGRDALRVGRRILVRATSREARVGIRTPMLNLGRVERRTAIPVLVPPDGNPNDPRFLALLDEHIRPDVALSYFYLRIFRPALLARFDQAVNFHDGLLPRHRGLLATSFSIYEGDAYTGFTFHRMTVDVDCGPILLQGSVPILAREAVDAVRRRQTAAARAALPQVLELIAAAAPGRPQIGQGSYHSQREAWSMTHLERPTDVTGDELARRLRAFGLLHIRIDGGEYPVTRLRTAGSNGSSAAGSLSFATADGVRLAVDRLAGLPVRLYRVVQPLYAV